VPGHRFLWFGWGQGTGEVEERATDFRFGSARAPLYLALLGRLQASDVAVGELLYESVPGTRAERLRGSVATFDSRSSHGRA
jgi:hypothetical protein